MNNYTDLRKQYLSEWRVWNKMINSCKNNIQYYVETEVCEEWQGRQGFINWFNYIGPRPDPSFVHDRINKLGDYEPGNVQWTTKSISNQLQRRHLDPKETAYWRKVARDNGINRWTFHARVHDHGWKPQDAATLPPSHARYKKRIV